MVKSSLDKYLNGTTTASYYKQLNYYAEESTYKNI